jgi:hypothetical protein
MGRSRDINAENVGGLSMIEVRITKWMYEKAKELAMIDKAKYGTHNTISEICSDNTRLRGKLGEIVISCYFNSELSDKDDYDIIINQERVEIKSRIINVDVIKPYYECNVFKPSTNFDRYMFVFVHSSHTKAWIVGTCSREEFDYKSYKNCPSSIKDKGTFSGYHIKIQDLEDVETWQSKFGRTVKAYGLMRRQADL